MRWAVVGVSVGVAVGAVMGLPSAGFAKAEVTVEPSAVMAGESFTITAGCGSDATGAALSGTVFGGPSEIPLETYTDGGPGAFRSSVTVPDSTLPGTYPLVVTCSDGESGSGTLVVTPEGAPAGGGGSTSAGVNRTVLAAGLGLLLLAGLGTVLLVRRRDGTDLA